MNATANAPPTRPAYAPATAFVVYVTEQCNLRCQYCFVDKKSRHMSVETARKVVDFILSRNISGVEQAVNITMFGGEPFTRPEIISEIIRGAREKGPNAYKRPIFSATTNGTLATPTVERIIRDADMRLLISMDGEHAASVYRPFVSGRSSYSVVAKNVPKLVSWSSDAVVRMTFHPEALDLVANVRHALDLGAPSVALCPVVEAHWEGHEEALEAAYQALADWYIAEARLGRIVPLEITHMMVQRLHGAARGGSRPPRACGAGQQVLGIDPIGNVMPCHRFLYRKHDWLGTVDQPQLDDRRNAYLHLSSRDILGCDTCVAEPVCGGGCRAVVLNAGLDLRSGAHPGYCLTTRAHARAAVRIYQTLTAEANPAFLRVLKSRRPLNAALTEYITR